jgi:hypothetical protein
MTLRPPVSSAYGLRRLAGGRPSGAFGSASRCGSLEISSASDCSDGALAPAGQPAGPAPLGNNADFAPVGFDVHHYLPPPVTTKAWHLRSLGRDLLKRQGIERRMRWCDMPSFQDVIGRFHFQYQRQIATGRDRTPVSFGSGRKLFADGANSPVFVIGPVRLMRFGNSPYALEPVSRGSLLRPVFLIRIESLFSSKVELWIRFV